MNNTTTGQANIPDFNLGKSDRGVRQQGLARKAVQFTTTPSGLIQPLPIWAWLLTGILVVCALKTKYPSLTVWAILLLPVIASLLRIKGVSGVLLACCLMQWLQIVTPVIYCDFRGVTFEEAFEFPEMAKATQLSLWGIMCLTVGIRVALGRWSTASVVMEQEASAISISRLARLWWIIFFVTSITDGLSWRAGSLQQVLVAIGSIKWVIFFVLCYKALNCRDGGKTLIIAMFIDFSKGLLGFFGTFKEVLLMFMIVIMSSAKTMSFRLRFLSFIVILLGLAASVFWSAVKMEYRSYLQDVWDTRGADISISQKISALRKISSRTEGGLVNVGIDRMIARLSYTQFFGATLAHVPSLVPHEGGTLWLGAIKHVLMPRLLFPEKGILDDSKRTAKYTGMDVAGRDKGTSIGIGYMAESYVDFGSYGMMVPIFILGLLMGSVYRFFVFHNSSRLWGTAIGSSVLFTLVLAYAYEGVKIFGGLISCSLVMFVLNISLGSKMKGWLTEQAMMRRR